MSIYFTEEDFYKRLSTFATDGRAMPRPNTSTRKGTKTNSKQSRYRQKCIAEGRCPHCGKPCAPFYECKERRELKTIGRVIKELIEEGKTEILEQEKGKQIIYKNLITQE